MTALTSAPSTAALSSFMVLDAEDGAHDSQPAHAQRLEMLGMLSCGIAHDLNNMLAIVEGYTSLVDRELPRNHAAHDWLDTISDAAHRGMEMVRQIMAFGRPGAERTRGQLRGVVESSLKLMRSTLPAKVELCTDLTQIVPDIEMNPGQITQIVMNLCINASHAIGSAAGRIELTIDPVKLDLPQAGAIARELRPGSYVRLSISDTGCGMSEATLRRIFEPYFTTKTPGKGTGLGLSTARDIVTAHGGEIVARSRLGEGATFDIYLPCARSAADVNADQRPDSAQDGRIQRIMHIEDDEPVAELMKELLERKGYAVESFRCPTQALAAFSAQPGAYDLIVTDMNMPALDGIELARKLRDLRREVPIVLLSGWVGPEEQMMAQAAGLNGVLLKSIDVHELTEALHRTCLTLAIGGAGRLQN